MAVCEIWDVRGRLDHPIDYAENPEKTANPNYSETDLQALVDVMEYATNQEKTEQRERQEQPEQPEPQEQRGPPEQREQPGRQEQREPQEPPVQLV